MNLDMFNPKKDIAELVKTSQYFGLQEPFQEPNFVFPIVVFSHQLKHTIRGGLFGLIAGGLYEYGINGVDTNEINILLTSVVGIHTDPFQYMIRTFYHFVKQTPSNLINE